MRAEVGKWPDLLDMDYINGLPQPLYWLDGPKWVWPVHDFEVGSGCFRIDVMGRLDVKHIGDATQFRDASGKVHLADDFYLDPECWVERASPRQVIVQPTETRDNELHNLRIAAGRPMV